ncbi:MAG: S8 family serine peptidase [Verrucomicrobiota bacterium]
MADVEFALAEKVNRAPADEPEDRVEEAIPEAAVQDEWLVGFSSKSELLLLAELAARYGGRLIGVNEALGMARFQFDSAAGNRAFRLSTAEGRETGANFLVKAPDRPEVSDPNPEEEPETLIAFGRSALPWLGLEDDHIEWGRGTKVAVLDTGISPHRVFDEMEVLQMDLIDLEAGGFDYDGHGTAVASIVAQVSPSAEILSVRVLDSEGIGNSFTVAEGIVAAADYGARVINLSMGTYTDSLVLSQAVSYALDRGVTVIAAAGNDGSGAPSYPAAYEGVIGVSAIDADGRVASFSNHGSSVDMAAPGVGVLAAAGETSAVLMSGTSAAAPFVAGTVAALYSEGLASTPRQIWQQLEAHAVDVGEVGVDPASGTGALQLGALVN